MTVSVFKLFFFLKDWLLLLLRKYDIIHDNDDGKLLE